MSTSELLLLTAAGGGTAGILLCTLIAAVERHMARVRYNIPRGELPRDIQLTAWRLTARSIGLVGIVCHLIFTYAFGPGWPATVFICSFLFGTLLRVSRAYMDLS